MSPHYLVKLRMHFHSVVSTDAVLCTELSKLCSFSPGSAVTFSGDVNNFITSYAKFSQDFVYEKILKSVHFRRSYLKMKRGTF